MSFYRQLLEGNYAKEIVRTAMDEAGYLVFPYGYESMFSYVKTLIQKRGISRSHTARKISSTPDLLVYDEQERDVRMVEVKMRNFDQPKIHLRLAPYFDFWRECHIVLVVPSGHWFYCQSLQELGSTKPEYDVRADFLPIEHVFPKLQTDRLYDYKGHVADFMNREGKHYFPENEKPNGHLLEFIRKNDGLPFDELFSRYNKENLLSSTLLRENLKVLLDTKQIEERGQKFYAN